MANVGKWRKHKFQVKSNLIRSFTDLQIKGSHETETKTKSKQKVETKKNSKATEVTLTIQLSAFTGCNVRKEALQFVTEARSAKKGYFYVGGKKLVKYKLILTDASVKNIEIAHNNKWVSAEVSLTLKQNTKSKDSGSSDSSSSGSGSGTGTNKKSVRTQTPVSTGGGGSYSYGGSGSSGSGTKAVADASTIDAISGAAPTAAKVKEQQSYINRTVAAAKTYSKSTKPAVVKPNAVTSSKNVRVTQ